MNFFLDRFAALIHLFCHGMFDGGHASGEPSVCCRAVQRTPEGYGGFLEGWVPH